MVFMFPHEVVRIVGPRVTVSPVGIGRRKLRTGPGIGITCGPNVRIIQIQGAQLVSEIFPGSFLPGSLENVEVRPEEGLECPSFG